MLKRVLSFILCLSILLCSISIYMYTPVYASDLYNTIYENYDYSSVISGHKSFNFTDKGGKKHPVVRIGNSWLAGFDSGQIISNDDDLNYYLSWYSYKGYNLNNDTGKGVLSLINSKLGAVVSLSSDLLSSVLLNVSDIDIDYNEDDGLTIASDSVDKLREEIKKQYYLSNGMLEFKSSGETAKALSGKRKYYEEEEDFLSDSADIRSFQCAFAGDDNGNYWTWDVAVGFNRDYSYAYFSPIKDDKYGYNVVFVNPDLTMCDLSFKTYLCGYYYYRDGNANNYKQFDLSCNRAVKFNGMYLSTYSEPNFFNFTYSFNKLGYSFYRKNNNSDTELASFSASSNPCYFYSNDNKPFIIFKSYEAMYNFAYGSQNAYLSSKVEETGEDIKISIDDMNTNISDKMDSLIDSINSKKDGMSADELQNAIDKGLESISGKMDDIKDNTEETNTKLDNLLSAMQSQNEILMNILGVTTDIYNVVSSKDKEDGTNYTIADLQPHFNKCFTAVKNMVLYGESSFEDVGTQSVMNVDNDVGIAVYADDPENHVKDYHNGLLGKFPFIVPYQLYEWLQVLQADPKTPEFTYDYGYMLKYLGVSSDTDTVIKFDLSQYDDWAKNARSFLKLSFTLAVAVGIYRKFKGEI